MFFFVFKITFETTPILYLIARDVLSKPFDGYYKMIFGKKTIARQKLKAALRSC